MRGLRSKASGARHQRDSVDFYHIFFLKFSSGAISLKYTMLQLHVDDCSAENSRLAKQLLELRNELASIVKL